jgi:hypothetical protein
MHYINIALINHNTNHTKEIIIYSTVFPSSMSKVLILAIVVILVVGSYMIVESRNLDLENSQDRESFAGAFWGWTKQMGSSTVNVIGYAVHQDLLPQDNKTIITCIYDDPHKDYVKKDKNCVINFLCIKNKIAFSDECGCGCKTAD